MIKLHTGMKIPFTVSLSNYTCKFDSSLYSVHFLKKAQSNQMFGAYNKIKADLKPLPHSVNMELIKYYQSGNKLGNLYADFIFQIDIKSCYASILRNYGLIKERTYEFLQKITKENRLACIGMLASKKSIFHFDNTGTCVYEENIQNEDSDYFFFCVQETFKIMDECKMILHDSFLFTWVDAIYFNGDSDKAFEVMQYLKEKFNLQCSCNALEQFEIKTKKDHYHCTYVKNNEPSFINIPFVEQPEKRSLLNYLHSLNFKKKK